MSTVYDTDKNGIKRKGSYLLYNSRTYTKKDKKHDKIST